jgi:hypothetical protein
LWLFCNYCYDVKRKSNPRFINLPIRFPLMATSQYVVIRGKYPFLWLVAMFLLSKAQQKNALINPPTPKLETNAKTYKSARHACDVTFLHFLHFYNLNGLFNKQWFSVSDATAASNTAQKIGFFLSFVRCQMRLSHLTLIITFV